MFFPNDPLVKQNQFIFRLNDQDNPSSNIAYNYYNFQHYPDNDRELIPLKGTLDIIQFFNNEEKK